MNDCFKCVFLINCDDCKKTGCVESCLWFGFCENCDASSDHCLLKPDTNNYPYSTNLN